MATKVKLIADGVITPDQITLTTASTGTNTTAPATTAFVQQEISALVDSSPEALNTLNELAAALGDDANFSTTVTNSIATKLPLAGGTMTGTIAGFTSAGIDDNATSTAITIDSSENVGIGESSPDDRLHVNSGSQNDVAKFESTDTTASLILVDSATTTDGNKIQTIGDTMNFQTGGTEAMRINASQQIGIGTTSPANNLHIHTDANGEGILVKSTGNTYNDIIGNANRTGAGTGIIRLRGE